MEHGVTKDDSFLPAIDKMIVHKPYELGFLSVSAVFSVIILQVPSLVMRLSRKAVAVKIGVLCEQIDDALNNT